MRNISDTIARLSAIHARSAGQGTAPGIGKRGPDRLRPLALSGANPGGLVGKYYIPDNLGETAPLVVVLHGCTQTAEGYDHHSGWSKLADEAGFALLFPEQQRANNPNLCFNWFLPGDTSRNGGEALSIRRMIATMVETWGLDPARIFITGLSAGGAMTSAMLASYPEVFAGGAIIAGLPHGVAATIPEAFDRMRGHGGPSQERLQRLLRDASDHDGPWPAVSIWHGSADQTVAVSNAEALLAQWRGVHKLAAAPTSSENSGRRTRRVWRDASGRPAVEVNVIAGMAHGTPLGGDGLGQAGPFMLDVGISSTREIASLWGIAGSGTKRTERPAQQATREDVARGLPATIPEMARPEETVSGQPGPDHFSDSSGIKKTIADALRSAGLMR